jgi:hypothetical protein
VTGNRTLCFARVLVPVLRFLSTGGAAVGGHTMSSDAVLSAARTGSTHDLKACLKDKPQVCVVSTPLPIILCNVHRTRSLILICISLRRRMRMDKLHCISSAPVVSTASPSENPFFMAAGYPSGVLTVCSFSFYLFIRYLRKGHGVAGGWSAGQYSRQERVDSFASLLCCRCALVDPRRYSSSQATCLWWSCF